MNKRILRKVAAPGRKLSLENGIFCAEQVKFVVCTAIHNIGGRRTLVLYVYSKETAAAGDFTPRWTMFQTKDEYITLCRDEKGTRWQTSMFNSLGREYGFAKKCAFYSLADEQRVSRFCDKPDGKGFNSLSMLQWQIFYRRQEENKRKLEQKILNRMKVISVLPRDIKGFMHRETLPQYIFYNYQRSKASVNGYCTACRHEVEVVGAKHNKRAICPRCGNKITFKSRGKRGYILDRSTAQVIQRTGENELVIRFVKAYRRFPKQDAPEYSVYENARLFLTWEGNQLVKLEPYYYSHGFGRLTPWHKGERPVFSRWRYNFEADDCGYLYHRNLDSELKGTPWQYSAIKEYYFGDPTPLYVASYLKEYLRYPMLEYLVKLHLYRLATCVVYGEDGWQHYGNPVINSNGKNVVEVLGVNKGYLPFLQEVNPSGKQLRLIRALLKAQIQPDIELMKWCSENDVGNEENLMVPLRFMTPHKLMRYASEQFATYQKTSCFSSGYYSMSYLLSDYRDYLCMSEALDYDMKNSFVLFPKNLMEAHNRVNDLSDAELSEAYDRKIAKAFAGLQSRYQFMADGLLIVPPRSANEIVKEGQTLHHCVGWYVKNVVQSKCVILFIRQIKAPHRPYCTIELKNGEVVQARIERNGTPPPEVEKFIELWKKQVLYAPAAAA